MTILYNLKSVAPGHWAIAKFDSDFNVAAIYNLIEKGHGYTCDCPANNRSVVTKPCKHKRMMPLMLGAANTPRFFDPEAGRWHDPLAAHLTADDASEASEVPELTIVSYTKLSEDANVAEEFGNLLAQPQPAATPASVRQAQAGEAAVRTSTPPLPTSGGLRRR